MSNEEAFLIGGGSVHRLIGPKGETPPCPDAKFNRGDVVKVRTVSELENIVDMPLAECEFCHKRVREDTLISLGDICVCEPCNSEWQAEYDACEHLWEPSHYYGRVCGKCGGTDYEYMPGESNDND